MDKKPEIKLFESIHAGFPSPAEDIPGTALDINGNNSFNLLSFGKRITIDKIIGNCLSIANFNVQTIA